MCTAVIRQSLACVSAPQQCTLCIVALALIDCTVHARTLVAVACASAVQRVVYTGANRTTATSCVVQALMAAGHAKSARSKRNTKKCFGCNTIKTSKWINMIM
jgi:hypothetical protein